MLLVATIHGLAKCMCQAEECSAYTKGRFCQSRGSVLGCCPENRDEGEHGTLICRPNFLQNVARKVFNSAVLLVPRRVRKTICTTHLERKQVDTVCLKHAAFNFVVHIIHTPLPALSNMFPAHITKFPRRIQHKHEVSASILKSLALSIVQLKMINSIRKKQTYKYINMLSVCDECGVCMPSPTGPCQHTPFFKLRHG